MVCFGVEAFGVGDEGPGHREAEVGGVQVAQAAPDGPSALTNIIDNAALTANTVPAITVTSLGRPSAVNIAPNEVQRNGISKR